MTVPIDYEQASEQFRRFLLDARDEAGLWSTHAAYTMAQGVLRAFRRRLSVQQALDFANLLPACLRALFVTDWSTAEPIQAFGSREAMAREVAALRLDHNFAPATAIQDVARALRKHVDEEALDRLLATFPEGAADFWKPS